MRLGVPMAILPLSWTVSNLHLLRERGSGGSIAWSGSVASHREIGRGRLLGALCAAMAKDEIEGHTGAYFLPPT